MSYHQIENISETKERFGLFIGLSLLLGPILALLPILLGPITLPIVFFVLLILPWLIQDAFRPFILLILTWPLLNLYFRVPLPAGIPDITYDRSMVLLLVCIIILEVLTRKRRLTKITLLDILVLIYFIAQLSSYVFVIWFEKTGNPDLNGLLNALLIPLMLYWLVKNLLVSRAHLKWLLYTFVIASLLICLTGLYEQAIGVAVFQPEWDDWGNRAAGVMINPAIYGSILGVGILAGFCLLYQTKRKLIRVAITLTIGILLFGVFLSYTRSAWVSVTVVLFAAQFFINDLWKKSLPIFMIGLLLLVFIWPTLSNSSFVKERASNTETIDTRINLLKFGWKLFLEKPIFGWGAGALNTLSQRQGLYSSHNIYLTFLVDGGLILFLSFSTIIGYLLKKMTDIYEMLKKGRLERGALVSMGGFIFIFLLSGLVLELRYFGYYNAIFWICVGVIDHLRSMVRMDRSASLNRLNDRYL
jgi:O-antigen ligase